MNPGPEFRAWLDLMFPDANKRGGRGRRGQITRAAEALTRSPRTIRMYATGRHWRPGRQVAIPAEVTEQITRLAEARSGKKSK